MTSSVAVFSLKNLELCVRCSHENEAPPALNATLDGSTCPWWKMGLFGRLKRFFYRKRNKLNRGQVLSPKCLLLSPIDLGTSVYFALTLSQSYAVGSLPIIFFKFGYFIAGRRDLPEWASGFTLGAKNTKVNVKYFQFVNQNWSTLFLSPNYWPHHIFISLLRNASEPPHSHPCLSSEHSNATDCCSLENDLVLKPSQIGGCVTFWIEFSLCTQRSENFEPGAGSKFFGPIFFERHRLVSEWCQSNEPI